MAYDQLHLDLLFFHAGHASLFQDIDIALIWQGIVCMIRCWRHDFGSEAWVTWVPDKNTAVYPQAQNYVSIAWWMGELRWTLRALPRIRGYKAGKVRGKALWRLSKATAEKGTRMIQAAVAALFFWIPGFCWDNPDGWKLSKLSLHPSMISMECRPFET